MDVSKSFNNLIKKTISEYSQRIIDEYENVNAQDLQNIWEEFSDTIVLNINDNEVIRCQYVFKKGPKSGKICGKKIKEGEYCCLHKDKENLLMLYCISMKNLDILYIKILNLFLNKMVQISM